MKKIKAFFSALFSSPKNCLKQYEVQLNSLKSEIEKIRTMPNKVEAIVKLFQVVSPIQDAQIFPELIKKLQKKNYGQIDLLVESTKTLLKHLDNAGRELYGFNRTKKGEAVTSENVYLGDVYGIWTKNAAYWLSHQIELENDPRPDLTKKDAKKEVTTWYCINDYQAGDFVEKSTKHILAQIKEIQSVA
jgi:hypothetical protein